MEDVKFVTPAFAALTAGHHSVGTNGNALSRFPALRSTVPAGYTEAVGQNVARTQSAPLPGANVTPILPVPTALLPPRNVRQSTLTDALKRSESTGLHLLGEQRVPAQSNGAPATSQTITDQKPSNGSGDGSSASPIPSSKPPPNSPEKESATISNNQTESGAGLNASLATLLSTLIRSTTSTDKKKRKVGWLPSIAEEKGGATVVSNGTVVRGDPSAVMEEGPPADGGDSDDDDSDVGSEGGADDVEDLLAAIAGVGEKVDVLAVAIVKVEKAMVELVARQNGMLEWLTRTAKSGHSP